MPEFTPGPWRLRGARFVEAEIEGRWQAIAELCQPYRNSGGYASMDEVRANGDLLAAATAMLTALEAARHALVTTHGLHATDSPNAYSEALQEGADANGAHDVLMETMHTVDNASAVAQIDASIARAEGRDVTADA